MAPIPLELESSENSVAVEATRFRIGEQVERHGVAPSSSTCFGNQTSVVLQGLPSGQWFR